MTKQFTLYLHETGPNARKVAIFLQELGLEYESKYLTFEKGEHKMPAYTKYNPNGRVPALIDHSNNDFCVWESMAILLYLARKYDPHHKFSGGSIEERSIIEQWMAFQISGVGPYQGQIRWYAAIDPAIKEHGVNERAKTRYINETDRVYTVLDKYLTEGNKKFLLGFKYSIADMMFYPWMKNLELNNLDLDKYPAVKEWRARLGARPAVLRAYAQ